LNLKVIAILLVVPVLAWKGLHEASEKQARLNEILTQHPIPVPQKAAFEACLAQTREVPFPGKTAADGTEAGARLQSIAFCACQSRQMVRVFSHGRYASFRSLLLARTLHDAGLANLDDDDLAEEWKQKPQTAQFVLELAMVACTKRARAASATSVKDTGTTSHAQAPS